MGRSRAILLGAAASQAALPNMVLAQGLRVGMALLFLK